jgi:hypothetical protein
VAYKKQLRNIKTGASGRSTDVVIREESQKTTDFVPDCGLVAVWRAVTSYDRATKTGDS